VTLAGSWVKRPDILSAERLIADWKLDILNKIRGLHWGHVRRGLPVNAIVLIENPFTNQMTHNSVFTSVGHFTN
jgi:hypothetical protein